MNIHTLPELPGIKEKRKPTTEMTEPKYIKLLIESSKLPNENIAHLLGYTGSALSTAIRKNICSVIMEVAAKAILLERENAELKEENERLKQGKTAPQEKVLVARLDVISLDLLKPWLTKAGASFFVFGDQ